MDAKDGVVPLRAVVGGTDSSGEKIYVGRAKHDGALLPGKIVPSHGVCYVSHCGAEHAVAKYQAGLGSFIPSLVRSFSRSRSFHDLLQTGS